MFCDINHKNYNQNNRKYIQNNSRRTQLGDALKKDKTPRGFLGPQRILPRDAVTYVSCHLTCESLYAFYFYVKQFCVLIKVNQSRCQRWDGMGMYLLTFHPHSSRISLINIVTQNMYSFEFWGSQHSSAPNCHTNTMSTVFRNWCQNHLHWKRSQFIVKSITTVEGVVLFYKTWCRVLVSIRIFSWPNIRIPLFPTNPSPSLCHQSSYPYRTDCNEVRKMFLLWKLHCMDFLVRIVV